MTADIFEFPRGRSSDTPWDDLNLRLNNHPLPFKSVHCEPALSLLGWSVEALAFRSNVSPSAIRRVEKGAELRRVTMQALAHTLEAEGLVFFPNHSPMRAENCRGATPDPRTRDDYHLLE